MLPTWLAVENGHCHISSAACCVSHACQAGRGVLCQQRWPHRARNQRAWCEQPQLCCKRSDWHSMHIANRHAVVHDGANCVLGLQHLDQSRGTVYSTALSSQVVDTSCLMVSRTQVYAQKHTQLRLPCDDTRHSHQRTCKTALTASRAGSTMPSGSGCF